MIAAGCNKNILDPYYHSDDTKLSIHAEEAAIRVLMNLIRRGVKMGQYKLYVARVNNQGNLVLSHPCTGCQTLISQFPIKTVIHS